MVSHVNVFLSFHHCTVINVHFVCVCVSQFSFVLVNSTYGYAWRPLPHLRACGERAVQPLSGSQLFSAGDLNHNHHPHQCHTQTHKQNGGYWDLENSRDLSIDKINKSFSPECNQESPYGFCMLLSAKYMWVKYFGLIPDFIH